MSDFATQKKTVTIPKNSTEDYQLVEEEYRGHKFLKVAICLAGTDRSRSTVAIVPSALDAIIKALIEYRDSQAKDRT